MHYKIYKLKHCLSLCNVIGSVLFISIFVILGIINKNYSAIEQQISVLAAYPGGIMLNIGFIFSGILLIIGVTDICINLFSNMNLRKIISIIMLSIPPFGLIICGLFPFDSQSSFMHIIGANLACSFPIVSFLITGILMIGKVKTKKIGITLLFASFTTVFCVFGYFSLSGTTFEDIQTIEGGGTLGLWERILAIEILLFYVILGIVSKCCQSSPFAGK